MSTYQKKNLGEPETEGFFLGLKAMIDDTCKYAPHPISALSNISSLIFDQYPNLNWAGFYIFDGEKLVVGPFQGKPACTEIRIGKGVCGTAAEKRETIVVDDVEQFPGHIACDAESKSELVASIHSKDGSLLGVIDLDSPHEARFDEVARQGFEKIAESLSEKINWKNII